MAKKAAGVVVDDDDDDVVEELPDRGKGVFEGWVNANCCSTYGIII